MNENGNQHEECPENSIRESTIEFSGQVVDSIDKKVADKPFNGDPQCRHGWSNNFRNLNDPALFQSKRGACKSPRCNSCGPAWANHQYARLSPRLSKGQWYLLRCGLTKWDALNKQIRRIGDIYRIRLLMADHYIVILNKKLDGAIELDNPLDTLKVKLRDACMEGLALKKLVTVSKGFAPPVYKPKDQESDGAKNPSEWEFFGKGIMLDRLYDALCEHLEWVSFPDVTLLKPVRFRSSFTVRFLVPQGTFEWVIAWEWFCGLMNSEHIESVVAA